MSFRSMAFLAGLAFAAAPAAAAPELSVDGVSLGMSLEAARTALGPTYKLQQAQSGKDTSVWSGKDETGAAIGLYFIQNRLIYAVYNNQYKDGKNLEFSSYVDSVLKKYGPYTLALLAPSQSSPGANMTWVFGPSQMLNNQQFASNPKLQACAREPSGLLLNVDGLNLPIPTQVPAECFAQIHVVIGKRYNSPTVASGYMAEIWDQKSMADYLTQEQQSNVRRQNDAAAAAAAAASLNKPHL